MHFAVLYHGDIWTIARVEARVKGEGKMLEMDMFISRASTYYMNSTVLPLYILGQVAAATIATSPEEFGSRYSNILTLLLTVVAFKFVINQFIPIVSYQTLLDRYFVIALLSICFWVLEVFCLSIMLRDEDTLDYVRKVDTDIGIIYTVVWFLFHVGICTGAYFDLFHPTWHDVERFNGKSIQAVHPKRVIFMTLEQEKEDKLRKLEKISKCHSCLSKVFSTHT